MPAPTVEGQAAHDALPAEPDALQNSLLGDVLHIGDCLEPVGQRRLEQVLDEQSLRGGPSALAAVLGKQQGADLQAANLRPAGRNAAPADDPRQGSVGQGDAQLAGVRAEPAVLLPAVAAGLRAAEAGGQVGTPRRWIGVKPTQDVEVGLLDRAQPHGRIGHRDIIARGGGQGEPAVEILPSYADRSNRSKPKLPTGGDGYLVAIQAARELHRRPTALLRIPLRCRSDRLPILQVTDLTGLESL